MVAKNEVIQIIYSAIDEINKDLPERDRLVKSPQTVLLGSEGRLDSLGFINFIVASEKKIREKWGVAVTLATQEAMSLEHSPFQTVEKLSEYIIALKPGAREDA
ncbi:MAG: hypothetical protein Q8Q08_01930 [Candidatus Omnitrophota bacterium]|nr:hypothetical protein [Candidatus Omnitrophota bacterium]